MGKIKTKLIKRTSKSLIEGGMEFYPDFEKNKKKLFTGMSSKKVKNQIAGYLARIKRRNNADKLALEESLKITK